MMRVFMVQTTNPSLISLNVKKPQQIGRKQKNESPKIVLGKFLKILTSAGGTGEDSVRAYPLQMVLY